MDNLNLDSFEKGYHQELRLKVSKKGKLYSQHYNVGTAKEEYKNKDVKSYYGFEIQGGVVKTNKRLEDIGVKDATQNDFIKKYRNLIEYVIINSKEKVKYNKKGEKVSQEGLWYSKDGSVREKGSSAKISPFNPNDWVWSRIQLDTNKIEDLRRLNKEYDEIEGLVMKLKAWDYIINTGTVEFKVGDETEIYERTRTGDLYKK